MELGCPTFVPVCDPEMGFEKIVRIAHARGGKTSIASFTKFLTHAQVLNRELALIACLFSSVCKQKDIVAALRTEVCYYVPRYMLMYYQWVLLLINDSLACLCSVSKLFSAWMRFYEWSPLFLVLTVMMQMR